MHEGLLKAGERHMQFRTLRHLYRLRLLPLMSS